MHGNWENGCIFFTHKTRICLTDIYVSIFQCLQTILLKMIIMKWCNIWTSEYDIRGIIYLIFAQNTNSARRSWQNVTVQPPRKKMTTMGKVDISNLIIMIRFSINVLSLPSEPAWVSWTNITPYTYIPTKNIEIFNIWITNTKSPTRKLWTDVAFGKKYQE